MLITLSIVSPKFSLHPKGLTFAEAKKRPFSVRLGRELSYGPEDDREGSSAAAAAHDDPLQGNFPEVHESRTGERFGGEGKERFRLHVGVGEERPGMRFIEGDFNIRMQDEDEGELPLLRRFHRVGDGQRARGKIETSPPLDLLPAGSLRNHFGGNRGLRRTCH